MVTIRLTRVGSKKRPFFRIVVVEGRTARDGSVRRELGLYDPRRKPEFFQLDRERFAHWVSKGAQAVEHAEDAGGAQPARRAGAAAAPAAS